MQRAIDPRLNRKLLVSVYSAQEAREAILGGGRIIDSEDPRSALGNISPRRIMEISDAVLDFQRSSEIQLSTNIGEDQLLFRRTDAGTAIEKSPSEIASKAAQAAIGVAFSMGTRVHPVSYLKVGVDGMEVDKVGEVLREVVLTLKATDALNDCQVMAVLFAQDLEPWEVRRHAPAVRAVLVELREFEPASEGAPDAFDIRPHAVNTLRDLQTGRILFSDPAQVSLAALIRAGILPPGSDSPFVRLNDLFEHRRYFPEIAANSRKTTRDVIQAMVDVTADSGATSIMIDTSILSKVSNICVVDTRGDRSGSGSDRLVDLNSLVVRDGMTRQGILSLDELRFFVDYCHYRGVAANLAGSIESYQAQQLWVLIPELDQMSTRGAGSAVDVDPSRAGPGTANLDTRQHRVIKRSLVRGIAPPEHGGVLNLPDSLRSVQGAAERIEELTRLLQERRKAQDLPDLSVFWVDRHGRPSPYEATGGR